MKPLIRHTQHQLKKGLIRQHALTRQHNRCPFSSSTMSCGTDDSPDLTCVPLSSWQLSFFPLLAVGGRETYKGPIQQCSPSPSPPTPPTPTPPWPPWNPVPPAPVPPGPSDPIIPSTTPLPGGGRGESTMVAEGVCPDRKALWRLSSAVCLIDETLHAFARARAHTHTLSHIPRLTRAHSRPQGCS